MLVLMMISLNVFSQKSKTVEIWNSFLREKLNLVTIYENNNKFSYQKIHFLARDARYKELVEYITVFYGTPKEIYQFFIEVEKFVKENELGTNTNIKNHSITYSKMLGSKYLIIYEEKKDGNGYCMIAPKRLTKIKNEYTKWCDKNNIKYN